MSVELLLDRASSEPEDNQMVVMLARLFSSLIDYDGQSKPFPTDFYTLGYFFFCGWAGFMTNRILQNMLVCWFYSPWDSDGVINV